MTKPATAELPLHKSKRKNFNHNTINRFYSVYVYESVNLDDGDSAIVESPFFFFVKQKTAGISTNRSITIKLSLFIQGIYPACNF
ncbi:hypothetical protein CA265_16225 [Sphingobacteriaceae bacterium GW460-11-11-14-LB5]|nr:hypothetical protein CA265_16225 [Sphingobacteriaceae bacterium GW460-11-11-14-LB5]